MHETVSAASVNALSFYSSNNQVKSQTVILKRHERTQVSENIGLDSIYIYISETRFASANVWIVDARVRGDENESDEIKVGGDGERNIYGTESLGSV